MGEVPDRSSGAGSVATESIAERAGYRPELRRALGFFSMFALAFSVISVTAGIFISFGFGLAHWGPASIWTWPVVGVGNLMVAFIVAELGTRIPLAGYAYQGTARLMNSTYGWFVGFAALLNMTAAGGAIALLAASPLILSEFNITGDHPHLVLAVAVMFLVLPVVFNIIGVQLAARVNNLAVFAEMFGTVVFGVLLFVLWGLQTEHTPRPRSSPWMRRCPQRGFCLASRRASSRISSGTGGRPVVFGQVHFFLTRRWCQASRVPGVTIRCIRRCRGSSRAKAAITARSAQSGFGRATWRRRTATSCRSTKISTFLETSLRARSASQPNNRTMSR
jgi:hypothetical protein